MNDADASSSIQEHPSPTGGASSQVPRQQSSSSLDDYEIIREIGRGGTAIVYEAYHKSLRRKVALKQLPAAAALDQRWQVRFHNEVHATSQLSHSNIVPFYELGNGGDSHFYTMQLIDGISLAEVIDRLRQCREGTRPCMNLDADVVHPAFLNLCDRCNCRFACRHAESDGKPTDLTSSLEYHRAVAELMYDVALAVQYAHDQGILHLDIKPSNILIDGEGRMWVMDFGAARSNGATGSERLSGTVCYASPEQAFGRDDQLDARSDVYSLGATLYEMLTLERPFADVSPHALLTQVSIGDFTAPRKVNESISPEFGAIITKAMARDPVDRYATVGELADDLQEVTETTGECEPKSDATSSPSLSGRCWLLIAALVTCGALMSLVPFVLGPEQEVNVVPDGLIGYWAAEDDARDSSGNEHHGTLTNGVSFAPSVRGKAFQFDGIDDGVVVADDPTLALTRSMTIEGWVMAKAFLSPGGVILFRGDDRGGLDPYVMDVLQDGRVRFKVESLTGAAKVAAPIPLDQFVHVAGTLDDATGVMQLYINGVSMSRTKTAVRPYGELNANSNPGIGIGNHGGYPLTPHNYPFHGLIDELRIYDKALTAEQVLANCDAGRGSQ